MTILLTVVTGLIYPSLITALCQLAFPDKANGSLIQRGGIVVGSALLGQSFTRPEYFHGRPSAAGSDGYDASASSGSNLGPTSQKLLDRVKASVEQAHHEQKIQAALPSDMVTASSSGLDPHVSPATAQLQVSRVAAARGTTSENISRFVEQSTEGRDLGVLGEPRVNVLQLNLALDEHFPVRK
jgi:K+-transporting ATPase ATPase C chain